MENEIEITKQDKIKKILKKPIIKIVLVILVLVVIFSIIKVISKNDNKNTEIGQEAKQVEVITIGENNGEKNTIETVGIVKAKTKIDVTALTSGIVKNIFFKVGDFVEANKTIVNLYDKSTLTNLINTRTDFLNRQNSLNTTEKINNELINQAELSVQSAEELINAAEISLQTTKDTLENAKAIQNKSTEDNKSNAIISYGSYLNTINSVLDQVNYIIKAEGNIQLSGISTTLGIKNIESLKKADDDYFILKDKYELLETKNLSEEKIASDMSRMIEGLRLSQILVDDLINVLENTTSNDNFLDTALTTQRDKFFALKNTVIGVMATAKSTLQGLENSSLTYSQEITALENAVRTAENQLVSARTNYNNAIISFNNTINSKDQNLISAQTALDNANGQYNLAGAQAADLNVKSPISGHVTKKYIELGTEVNPGQKIAEVSQTDLLTIEVDLNIEDIKGIKTGEEVNINSELKGTINQIYPTADQTSKKVKVEILFDNAENQLIAESFVDVLIPIEGSEYSNKIFVPIKAVNFSPSENYVYIARDGEAKKVTVETNLTVGDKIEITSGLSNGDNLIIDGGKNLEEGNKIEIK